MSEIKRVHGGARGRSSVVVHRGTAWAVATAEGASVAEQTRNSLAKLDRLLGEAGTDRHHILEATIYLVDMATKAEMDAVWCAWIPDDGWPRRACVGAALHGGDLVEIKLSAAVP